MKDKVKNNIVQVVNAALNWSDASTVIDVIKEILKELEANIDNRRREDE